MFRILVDYIKFGIALGLLIAMLLGLCLCLGCSNAPEDTSTGKFREYERGISDYHNSLKHARNMKRIMLSSDCADKWEYRSRVHNIYFERFYNAIADYRVHTQGADYISFIWYATAQKYRNENS